MYRRRYGGYRRWFRRQNWYNSDDSDEEIEPIPIKKPKVERVTKPKTGKRPAQPIILYENPPGEPASNATFMDMNDDCINEIFLYLDADDLCSLSTQCQRLQNLATETFMARFPAKVAQVHHFQENGHWLRYPGSDNHIVCFANFNKISIGNSVSNAKDIASLHHYLIAKEESRIDEIRFEGWRSLRPTYGKALADIVQNTKSVIFSRTKIFGEIHKAILCRFPAMEHLVLWNSVEMKCNDDDKDNWLMQEYPNLKRFSWFLKDEIGISDKMIQFFERNENIQHFSLYTNRIQTLERCFEAGIDVTHLYIRITRSVEYILEYLKTNCGSMRLHLLFEDGCRSELTSNLRHLAAVKNNLDGLYFGALQPSQSLATAIGECVHLKHLQIKHSNGVDAFASLPNLENLYVARGVVDASFNAIWNTMFAIATQAPKLKNIFVRNSCRPFSQFNFQQFSMERSKLPNATKVTIHIRTKAPERRFEMSTMQLHYDMVDIKTVEAEDVVNPLVTDWLYAQ